METDIATSLNTKDKEKKMIRICPICGSVYTEEPALSRKDNTEICPTCGLVESLESAPIPTIEKEEIVLRSADARDPYLFRSCVQHIISFEESPDYIYKVFKELGFNDSEIMLLGFSNNIEDFKAAKEDAEAEKEYKLQYLNNAGDTIVTDRFKTLKGAVNYTNDLIKAYEQDGTETVAYLVLTDEDEAIEYAVWENEEMEDKEYYDFRLSR